MVPRADESNDNFIKFVKNQERSELCPFQVYTPTAVSEPRKNREANIINIDLKSFDNRPISYEPHWYPRSCTSPIRPSDDESDDDMVVQVDSDETEPEISSDSSLDSDMDIHEYNQNFNIQAAIQDWYDSTDEDDEMENQINNEMQENAVNDQAATQFDSSDNDNDNQNNNLELEQNGEGGDQNNNIEVQGNILNNEGGGGVEENNEVEIIYELINLVEEQQQASLPPHQIAIMELNVNEEVSFIFLSH